MASTKVSDYILQRLREWDVDHVFGYAGDGINGLLAAWGRADNEPKFVQARHEEMAAFQAVGYAKFSGKAGVCAATSGPGAIHLLNGLYDAKLDHVPVVALVGQTNRSAMGGSYQQEVDLASLFKDVASDFCETAPSPSSCRTSSTAPSAPPTPGAPSRRSSCPPTCRNWTTARRRTPSRWCPPASVWAGTRRCRTTRTCSGPPTC